MRLDFALLGAVIVAVPLQAAELHVLPAGAVVYLDPQRPEASFFVVENWPSYIFAPGAPLYLRNRQLARNLFSSSPTMFTGDLDCRDFSGPVVVSGRDPHRLDGDGDGIGCE
jgi:hypothetical protein